MVSPMQRINAARRAGDRNRESSVFVFNEDNHTVSSIDDGLLMMIDRYSPLV